VRVNKWRTFIYFKVFFYQKPIKRNRILDEVFIKISLKYQLLYIHPTRARKFTKFFFNWSHKPKVLSFWYRDSAWGLTTNEGHSVVRPMIHIF